MTIKEELVELKTRHRLMGLMGFVGFVAIVVLIVGSVGLHNQIKNIYNNQINFAEGFNGMSDNQKYLFEIIVPTVEALLMNTCNSDIEFDCKDDGVSITIPVEVVGSYQCEAEEITVEEDEIKYF